MKDRESAPVDAVVMASATPKERPILFSGPMVRAILAGRKTQTRRVVKPQFGQKWGHGVRHGDNAFSVHVDIAEPDGSWKWIRCPYGKPGDCLWVRETWRAIERFDGTDGVLFAADGEFVGIDNTPEASDWWGDAYGNGRHGDKWRPSIFMPRWASRITLEITGVRVEQLGDITESDAIAEGAIDRESLDEGYSAVGFFNSLWAKLNGDFDRRTWVWVVEFKRLG